MVKVKAANPPCQAVDGMQSPKRRYSPQTCGLPVLKLNNVVVSGLREICKYAGCSCVSFEGNMQICKHANMQICKYANM